MCHYFIDEGKAPIRSRQCFIYLVYRNLCSTRTIKILFLSVLFCHIWQSRKVLSRKITTPKTHFEFEKNKRRTFHQFWQSLRLRTHSHSLLSFQTDLPHFDSPVLEGKHIKLFTSLCFEGKITFIWLKYFVNKPCIFLRTNMYFV